jgi:hypothetical protein
MTVYTFTHWEREVKIITKLVKDKNINVTYKTNQKNNRITTNTNKVHVVVDSYDGSGIYQLNCFDCPS